MKFICLKCGYQWIGGQLDRLTGKVRRPKFCSRCHNPNWKRKTMKRQRKNRWM